MKVIDEIYFETENKYIWVSFQKNPTDPEIFCPVICPEILQRNQEEEPFE